MVNQSKIKDPRFWEKWRKSGAIGTIPQKVENLEYSIKRIKSIQELELEALGWNWITNMPDGEAFQFKRTIEEKFDAVLVDTIAYDISGEKFLGMKGIYVKGEPKPTPIKILSYEELRSQLENY